MFFLKSKEAQEIWYLWSPCRGGKAGGQTQATPKAPAGAITWSRGASGIGPVPEPWAATTTRGHRTEMLGIGLEFPMGFQISAWSAVTGFG